MKFPSISTDTVEFTGEKRTFLSRKRRRFYWFILLSFVHVCTSVRFEYGKETVTRKRYRRAYGNATIRLKNDTNPLVISVILFLIYRKVNDDRSVANKGKHIF